MSLSPKIEAKLQALKSQGSFRSLKSAEATIDFSSNDYLGLARHEGVQSRANQLLQEEAQHGSTGSRLLSGEFPFFSQVESQLAEFYQTEAALMFNSGYDANLGLISALASLKVVFYFDEFVHASMRDGMRMSRAECFKFRHQDWRHLEERLQYETDKTKVVLVEALYSMHGDYCAFEELVALCSKYGAHLIIDEAHSGGIVGPHGSGAWVKSELDYPEVSRIHTFGKAFGGHGAAVVGSQALKDYLVNTARPLIFSTAPSFANVAHIKAVHELMPMLNNERSQLQAVIGLWHTVELESWSKQDGPIQYIELPGNEQVLSAANFIQQAGLDVRAIRYPTVPEGQERIRVCLHAYNTIAELKVLKTAYLEWQETYSSAV